MNWSMTGQIDYAHPPPSPMSALHPPDITHVMNSPRPSLLFITLPLLCIIVSGNWRAKNRVGLGTRLQFWIYAFEHPSSCIPHTLLHFMMFTSCNKAEDDKIEETAREYLICSVYKLPRDLCPVHCWITFSCICVVNIQVGLQLW